MKIKYLGTAAAEATPAFFCSCEVCEKSRQAGGKNIRTRSQALIDGDLLIDFPADTYLHIMNYGLDLRDVKSLLITHGHDDHMYADDLVYRLSPVYAHFPNDNKDKQPLDIFVSKKSSKKMLAVFKAQSVRLRDRKALKVHTVKAYEPFVTNGYTVTPLRANHATGQNLEPLIYIIQKDRKTLLYAHDTGYFFDDVWDYLVKSGKKFDFVSLDCTSTNRKEVKGTHMNLTACCMVKDRLIENNLADDKTVFCLNHFSHNGGYTYDELVPIAEEIGFIVSYDTMEVEF